MSLRRIAEHVRHQNWFAVWTDFAILVYSSWLDEKVALYESLIAVHKDIQRQNGGDPDIRYVDELRNPQIDGNAGDNVGLCLIVAIFRHDVVNHRRKSIACREMDIA